MFSTCFEVFFPVKKFAQCTLEGREIEKFQKMEKNSNFQNPEKRFQKCPNLFWGDFFRTFLDQCNLEIKTCRNSKKKSKKIEFLKVSKNVLKSFQTSVELVLRYFSGKKNCPVHPGGSKHGKTSEKWKNFHFFPNAQKRSPKSSNTFWTCFEVVFSVKKIWPVHPRGSKLGKIRKKNIGKNLKFRKCSKTFLRVSKHVLRWFYQNFLFSAPWRVEKSKNFKKMEKNQIFKIPKNVSKSVQIYFEVIFFELFLTSAPWRSKLVEIRKKIEKNWIPKSVQKRS